MTTSQPFSLFISSKMQELAEERRAIQVALSQYRMHGWLWEKDAGARPESIRHTYLQEVEACDLYIGLFWLGYGPYTIEEFEHAHQHNKPCLIYEKYVNVDQRDPQLQIFLDQIGKVDNPKGLTICRFETPKELADRVQEDVMRLLTEPFRKGSKQPAASQPSGKPQRLGKMRVKATKKSIAIGINDGGTVTQNNYGDSPQDDEQEA